MEDYEYKVIKLHATLFQNGSKSTGNISKHTGKLTSETNRIRLGGAMGGLPPLAKPPTGVPWAWAGLEAMGPRLTIRAPRAHGTPGGGIHSREARREIFPPIPLG